MKHAVVIAHPDPASLTCAVGRRYARAVEARGHEALVRDLYGLAFDPCLKAAEIPRPSGYRVAGDVIAERERLNDVDVFAFIYPLWFNAPPAILKGYVDRVFSMGFGYEPGEGGNEAQLGGKGLISFTSSGAPEHWVRDTGAMQALMTLFDEHLAAVCGLNLIDHVHVGGIVGELRQDAFDGILAGVDRAVAAHFTPPP